jgi:hypothetical protein
VEFEEITSDESSLASTYFSLDYLNSLNHAPMPYAKALTFFGSSERYCHLNSEGPIFLSEDEEIASGNNYSNWDIPRKSRIG